MRALAVRNNTFDYASLDDRTRAVVIELDSELDCAYKVAHEVIGRVLLRAKAELEHGLYERWYQSRGLTKNRAWRCVQAALGRPVKGSKIEPLLLPSADDDDDKEEEDDEEKPFNPIEHGMGQSEKDDWLTPREIVEDVVAFFGGVIDLDPASNSHETPNIPARKHYTKEDDGLSYTWEGKVFLNPPYGREIAKWVDKLLEDYQRGHIREAIALLPARMDTQWFIPLYDYPICFIIGRICFSDGDGAAPFPSCLVYLGKRVEDFVAIFKQRGPVMQRIG